MADAGDICYTAGRYEVTCSFYCPYDSLLWLESCKKVKRKTSKYFVFGIYLNAFIHMILLYVITIAVGNSLGEEGIDVEWDLMQHFCMCAGGNDNGEDVLCVCTYLGKHSGQ